MTNIDDDIRLTLGQIELNEAGKAPDLPQNVRDLARSRLEAFDLLTSSVHAADAAGTLDRARTGFDATAGYLDATTACWLRRYRANPVEGEDLERLKRGLRESVIDMTARRTTLDAVLASRTKR